MSGILTQDSISLTESLDGVRFSNLATSSWKTGTIRSSSEHPTHSDMCNKRVDSVFFYELHGKLTLRTEKVHRHVHVLQMFWR